ncbi:MAG: ABC transporter substrate-binding protein [Thiohalobacteraceae bacterium]
MKRVGYALVLALTLNAATALAESRAPEALVRETSEQMLAMLKEQREVIAAEPGRLYGLVYEIVLPHFDFERMSRWVLGKHWRQATPEQQQAFVDQFRNLLVRTYGAALREYTDQNIVYLPVRRGADSKEVTVRTEVTKPGGVPIPIHYSMYLSADGWKVYDVVIDGISLVSNYRTSFASEIRNAGIDGLIKRLVDRNAQGAT